MSAELRRRFEKKLKFSLLKIDDSQINAYNIGQYDVANLIIRSCFKNWENIIHFSTSLLLTHQFIIQIVPFIIFQSEVSFQAANHSKLLKIFEQICYMVRA